MPPNRIALYFSIFFAKTILGVKYLNTFFGVHSGVCSVLILLWVFPLVVFADISSIEASGQIEYFNGTIRDYRDITNLQAPLRPYPLSTPDYVNLHSLSILFLVSNVDRFSLSVAELLNELDTSHISEDMVDIRSRLLVIRAVAQQSCPVLRAYMDALFAYTTNMLSSPEFRLLEHPTFSWSKFRSYKDIYLPIIYRRTEVISSVHTKVTGLRNKFGPQECPIFHVLDLLHMSIEDLSGLLLLEASRRGEEVSQNNLDEGIAYRLHQALQRLKFSFRSAHGHLNFIQDVINDIAKRVDDVLTTKPVVLSPRNMALLRRNLSFLQDEVLRNKF